MSAPLDQFSYQIGGFDPALALELAQSANQVDRDKLLIGVAELCRDHEECARPEVQSVLRDVFMTLVEQTEARIRQRLSKTLADVDWAPVELVNLLAREHIDIARPILSRSQVLTNHDLIRLLIECSIEHKIEIARRSSLDDLVVTAIVEQAEGDVLTALANNLRITLSAANMSQLVSLSEQVVSLRAPIARRPELTAELAALLYGWVGEALRKALSQRFPDEAMDLGPAVRASVNALTLDGDSLREPQSNPPERTGMERRVVEKLQAAGQLRPGLAIRALNEGKLPMFVTVLGALAGFSTDDVRSAVNADHVEPLIVICTLAGIDKGAFPTLLSLVQKLNKGRPGAGTGRETEPGVGAPTAPLIALTTLV